MPTPPPAPSAANIHGLIREGTTFRHPDADLPTDPELPEPLGPVPYGRPEARTPDPDDPLDPSPPEERPTESDTPPGGWFRP